MIKTLENNINYYPKRFFFWYFSSCILLICGIIIFAIPPIILIPVFLLPFLIISLDYLSEYLFFYLIASLFVSFSLQHTVNLLFCQLVAAFCSFYFITNAETRLFNSFKLPRSIKISGFLIIGAVILSSITTIYLSKISVFFALQFIIWILLSYTVFRYIKNTNEAESLINFFTIGVSVSAIIIILQILFTGVIRSVGIAGFAIMDFSACALLIILLNYVILGKAGLFGYTQLFLVSIILISTLSRFAWLSFVLSLLYAVIISFIYSSQSRKLLKTYLPSATLAAFFILGIAIVGGLHNLILDRFGDVSLNLFQSDSGQFTVTNSLETRLLIWLVALKAFLANPWTGIGYMMFHRVNEDYNFLPQALFDGVVRGNDAHTTFLNFLVETGIVGFVCFLIYIITVYNLSLKSIKLSSTLQETRISIILNALVFFIFVNSIYSGAYTFGQNAIFMHIIFGIAIGNYVYIKTKQNFVHGILNVHK